MGDLRSHCTHVSPKTLELTRNAKPKRAGPRAAEPLHPRDRADSLEPPKLAVKTLLRFRSGERGRSSVDRAPSPCSGGSQGSRSPRGSRSSQLRASAGSPGCLCSRCGSKPEVQPRLPQALLRILHLRAGIICMSTERGFPFLLGAVGTGQQQQPWVPKSPPLTMPGALPRASAGTSAPERSSPLSWDLCFYCPGSVSLCNPPGFVFGVGWVPPSRSPRAMGTRRCGAAARGAG